MIFFKSGNTLAVRLVRIRHKTGEIEYLMTNLTSEEFDTDEISWLYNLRWGIETNYHYLKESMKITNISSSKEELIKQDIYSQMYVFNLLQTVQNEAEKEIVQENYKHKMKININMAVGYIKRYFIVIMLREEPSEWEQLYNRLHNKILKEIVPIRKGRKYERTTCSKNRHHINKRKAFNG